METLLQPNQAGSVGTLAVVSVLFEDTNRGTESCYPAVIIHLAAKLIHEFNSNIDNSNAAFWWSQQGP